MIKIFCSKEKKKWNDIVRSFPNHDVYYLYEYVHPFYLNGDGEPQLMFYTGEGLRAIYVYMKRPTELECVYDSISPYGYGGVLFDGDACEENKQVFWKEYLAKMNEENIVDNFVRYHPVLANAEPMKYFGNVIDLGKTIAIDLTSHDVIWDNFTSKNRGKIRKAEKNGIEILHGQGMDLFEQFIPIYNGTMDKDDATDYYYFKMPFYEAIHNGLKDNYEMFYAVLDGKIIMMAIMLYANGQMHYHLSGTDMEYKALAPNNLILYKAAVWGCEHGLKTLHLGGGVGSGEDSLYKFKEGFNKQSDYRFSIGKEIYNQELYDKLVQMRAEKDPGFDSTSHFFPLYRA